MSMSLAITVVSRPYIDKENNMVSILFCVIDILGAVSSIVPKILAPTDLKIMLTNRILLIVAFVSIGLSLLLMIVYCVVGKYCGKCKTSSRYCRIVSIFLLLFGLPILLATFPTADKDQYYQGFQIVFVVALMCALLVVIVLAFKAMGERIRILHDTMIHGTDNQSIWKAYTKCEVIFLFPILVIVFVVSFIAKVLCFNHKNKNRSKLTTVVPDSNDETTQPETSWVI